MARRRARRILPPTLLGLALVILSVGLKLSDNRALELMRNRLEWVAFDWRMRATLDRHVEKDPRAVIADIDERRTKVAALVDRLGQAGRRSAAVFFSVEGGGDEDGVIRRVALLQLYGDGLYSLLALEVARLYLGMPPVDLRIERFYRDRALKAISVGGFIEIPMDRQQGASAGPLPG
jgi:hypothetical protein